MNRLCYRIIFNKRRGQLMAVSETANSQSPGTDRPLAREGGGRADDAFIAPCRPLVMLLALLGCQYAWLPVCHAQVVAYRPAPGNQQPTVLSTGNGVPLINIQTPSAAGVSRNTYSQFDVDDKGAILNNSRRGATTVTGGQVAGNPWMAKGTAKVILNEVVSSKASQLRGAIEVAGDRAEVIIANPSGIDADGGRFINASGAVLTTGKVNLKGGAIDNYEVRQGVIVVGNRGLDASQADYTALLSRAVKINGELHAKEAKVIAGANRISADLKEVTRITGTGPAPEFALDVSALGGMYAGKITMVGTEAGVGVRNAGNIIASAGEVVITPDGRLVNTGQIISHGDADIAAGGVINKGKAYARGSMRVVTHAGIENTGLIGAQVDTTLRALGEQGDIVSELGSYLLAGLMPDGSMADKGVLSLEAGRQLQASGNNHAGESIIVKSPSIGVWGGDTRAPVIRFDVMPNTTTRRSRVRRESGDPLPAASDDQGSGSIDARNATIIADQLLVLHAPERLQADNATIVASLVDISVAELSNRGGRIVQTGTADLNLELSGHLNNSGGSLYSAAGSKIVAAGMDNAGGEILSSANLEVRVAGHLDNGDGIIAGAGATRLDVGSLDNAGHIDGLVVAQTYLNNIGSIKGSIDAATRIDNAGWVGGDARSVSIRNPGTITGGATADDNLENAGRIGGAARAGGDLVSSGSIGGGATAGGDISNSGDIGGSAVAHGSLDNAGLILGGASAGGAAINSGAISGTLRAGGMLANSGSIGGDARAGGDLVSSGLIGGHALSGADLRNFGEIGGEAVAGGGLVNAGRIGLLARSAGDLANSGSIGGSATAGGSLSNGGSIGGSASAAGNLSSGGSIGGSATAGGNLSNGGSIGGSASAAGNLSSGGSIGGSATAGGNLSNGGSIGGSASAAGNLSSGGSIGGSATAGGNLSNGGSIGGSASAAGNLSSGGSIGGSATAGGNLSNGGSIGGSASAAGNLNSGGSIGGSATAGGSLSNGGSIGGSASAAGNLSSGGSIGGSAMAGGSLSNGGSIGGSASAAGNLSSGGSIGGSATAGGSLSNGGSIGGSASAAGSVTNGGSIASSVISGGAISNTGSISGSATAAGGVSNDGSIASSVISGGAISNTGSISGSATAAGGVSNDGSIASSVLSGGAISNTGSINGSATAAGGVTNDGSIASSVISGGAISNTGSINGSATAVGGVTNDGNIANSVVSGANLSNTGNINGSATAAGRVINDGSIASSVVAGLSLENAGYIGKSALAGEQIVNQGSIGAQAANASISAAQIINSGILGSQDGNTIVSAQLIDNTNGTLKAGRDLLLLAQSKIDNTNGKITAGAQLALVDANAASGKTLSIINTNGTVLGGSHVVIDSANLSFDGAVISRGAFSADLLGDYNRGSSGDFFQAAGPVSLSFSGVVTNSGNWHVDQGLAIRGAEVINTGSITSHGITKLQATSGSLINQGLIHGEHVVLQGFHLDNRAGQLTGNSLSLDLSGSMNNVAGRVDIRNAGQINVAGDLNNDAGRIDTGSLGLRVGGNLDNSTLTGRVQTLEMQSSLRGDSFRGNEQTRSSGTETGTQAGITARSGDLDIGVGGNLTMNGGELTAQGSVTGFVLGDINVGVSAIDYSNEWRSSLAFQQSGEQGIQLVSGRENGTRLLNSQIVAGGELKLIAGGSANYVGSTIRAGENIQLGAVTGDLQLSAAVDGYNVSQQILTEASDGITAGSQQTQTIREGSSAIGGILEAGQGIELLAGHDLQVDGQTVSAGRGVRVQAGHDIRGGSMATARNEYSEIHQMSSDSDGNAAGVTTQTLSASRQLQHGGSFSGQSGILFEAGLGQPFAASFQDEVRTARSAAGMSADAVTSDGSPGTINLRGFRLAAGDDTTRADITLIAAGDISLRAAWDSGSDTTAITSQAHTSLPQLLARQAGAGVAHHSGEVIGQISGRDIQIHSAAGNVTLAGISAHASHDLNASSAGDLRIDSANLRAERDMALHAEGRLSINGMIRNPQAESGLRATAASSGNDHTPITDVAGLSAGNDLTLSSRGGIQARAVDLAAGETLRIESLGQINIEGGVDHQETGSHRIRDSATAASLTAKRVSVNALGEDSDISLRHINLSSSGQTSLYATGDVSIDPGSNYSYDYTRKTKRSGNPVKRKKTVTETVRESTTILASSLDVGGLDIVAKGDITLTATRIQSRTPAESGEGPNVSLIAGGDITYRAAHDQNYLHIEKQSSSSFGGLTYKRSSSTQTTRSQQAMVTSIQSTADVLSHSDGRSTFEGTHIRSDGQIRLQAGQGVDILPAENSHLHEASRRSWSLASRNSFGDSSNWLANGVNAAKPTLDHRQSESVSQSGSSLVESDIRGDRVIVSSNGDINQVGGKVFGTHGVNFLAGNNIDLRAGYESHSSQQDSQSSGHGFSTVKTDGRLHIAGPNYNQDEAGHNNSDARSQGSRISSELGQVTLTAGQQIKLQGAQLDAGSDIHLTGTKLVLGGRQDSSQTHDQAEAGTFVGKMRDGHQQDQHELSIHYGQLNAGGQIHLTGQQIELGAIHLNGKQGTQFHTSQLTLTGETGSRYHNRDDWDKDRGYEAVKGEGSYHENLHLTRIGGSGDIRISEGAQIRINLDSQQAGAQAGQTASAEQLRNLASQLASEPGLGYLGQLAQRPDIDWQGIATAHQDWDYKAQGLTQEGAIVLTAVVAILTYGSGAELVGAAADAAVTTAVANAGFTALATTTAVSLANNGGDLGKTLGDLGSSDTVKNVVSSMLTAGLTQGFSQYLQGQQLLVSDLSRASLGERFAHYATRAAVGAGVQSAVFGQSLEETAKTALINSVAQSLTSEIGDWGKGSETLVAKTLAHAAVQCAAASAQGKDCGSAALGAATAEVLSPYLDRLDDRQRQTGIDQSTGSNLAGIAATLAASIAGRDPGAANHAAQMVDYFNRQLHPEEKELAKELARKSKGRFTEAEIADALRGADNSETGESALSSSMVNAGLDAALGNNPTDAVASGVYDQMIPGQTTDAAQPWLVSPGEHGMILVQNMAQLAKPSAELMAFILQNTGSTYTWNPAIWQAGATPATPPDRTRYGLFNANGQSFRLPLADCPAAGCATSPIAWASANPQDQAALRAFESALDRQGMDDLATAATLATALTPIGAGRLGLGNLYTGFVTGAGFDAAGQYVQRGEVRPMQTLVAGLTGAGGLRLAAGGGAYLVPLTGATVAATNTSFNNFYYGEGTNVYIAAGLGAFFSGIAPPVGSFVSNTTNRLLGNPMMYIPASGPVQPMLIYRDADFWAAVPGHAGTTVTYTVGSLPSFIPLDSGKPEARP
jgi:filamentous hemagglutinin family protein